MRIATWNINSVRLRKELVVRFLKEYDVDILCLQETKTEDKNFPKKYFDEAGYGYSLISGEKSYNGVAIISRLELHANHILSHVNDDKRHISTRVAHKHHSIELHNFYIPAGGDEPDEKINPKFKHKLEYVDEVGNWFKKNHYPSDDIIILGDFNIAPYEHDVWSHKQLLKVVSHTPIEVEKLNKMKESINFVDVARQFVPDTEKLYSWWSYRNKDWKKSNRGRRLDHIWATKNIAEQIKGFEIVSEIRDWQQPSDHVPVIIEL